jgi:hydroxyethylthiazole kinase
VVLDPVGAGATSYRTDTDLLIIRDVGPDIVRGNPGEIAALIGAGGEVRGVESVGTLDDPVAVAKLAANAWGATVAMTGARDLITDGSRTLGVENGDRWLTTLTGTGCSSTAMVAAYAAVESDYVLAAAGALAHLGYAAEVAAKDAKGPGSFKAALHDAIYNMTPDMLAENMRAVELG